MSHEIARLPDPPGLEYPLIFGLPENKTEIFHSRMRVVWPFSDPEETERAFLHWLATLERWQDCRAVAEADQATVGAINIRRARRYVEIDVPMSVDTFFALQRGFWQPDLWGITAPSEGPGYYSPLRHGDVRMNLWRAFWDIESRTRGHHCYGDVMLGDDTTLYFDHYYYSAAEPMPLIADAYAGGTPQFVAQIVTPATREADYGPRMALWHRAGIAHLWLLDPAAETLEVFHREAQGYRAAGCFRTGDTVRPEFCPEVAVAVGDLFKDQDWPRSRRDEAEEPERAWLVPPDQRLGLEHLLLLGHCGRRYEIWRDCAPCVLAFASAEEATVRMRAFVEEAVRWTGAEAPRPLQLSDDTEATRVGLFQFTRRRNRVCLDVAVDGRVYLRMLEPLADRSTWSEDEE